MRISWHPDAESELIEAARFYNERVPDLGGNFLDAVDEAVGQISRDPRQFPKVRDDIQRARVRRFPYCVYFRCLPEAIRILVVKHHSRHSDVGTSRH